jgi:hypothetical protein
MSPVKLRNRSRYLINSDEGALQSHKTDQTLWNLGCSMLLKYLEQELKPELNEVCSFIKI